MVSLTTKLVETSRQTFLCGVSLCYAIAFISYYVQIPGLFGPNGVLPAHLYMNRHRESSATSSATTNFERFISNPNMLYLLREAGLSVEEGMVFSCLLGTIFALFSFSSRISRGMIVYGSMWFLYFSLVYAGQTFLSFQWDILLLETGFLAIVIAPLNFPNSTVLRVKRHDEVVMLLVKFLLFKLMFMSGVVKLSSLCPTWWDLTALTYHYETQCIPTPIAWFAHSIIPFWFHKLSVVAVYVIEIVLPFYLFSPIKAHRKLSIYSIIFLMVVIILSGNYNFFNLLTIVLCLGSLEDCDYFTLFQSYENHHSDEKVKSNCPLIGRLLERVLRWVMDIGIMYWIVRLFKLKFNYSSFSIDSSVNFTHEQFQSFVNAAVTCAIFLASISLVWIVVKNCVCALKDETGIMNKLWSFSQTFTFGFIATLLLTMSFVPIMQLTDRETEHLVPEFAESAYFRLQEFRVSNSYGLFRRMTGILGRPEIVLEGSASEKGPWTEFHFLYKPGNLSAPPPWVAPHQPRLDWQMWFAALSTPEFTTWFKTLAFRILTGQPEVLALMDAKSNIKFKEPPLYIRAVKYKYFFTKGNTQNWWRREKETKLYLDPVSLKSPALLDHVNRNRIKTVTPPQFSDKWPFLRRMLYRLRPQMHSENISGDILVWSLVLPLIAMKLGKVFSPKYPVKMYYI